ncbi:MAG: hypothetical protein LC772_03640, partial [Chloroflexi bacterium]|nr:hypothetical protein [Chloroflexota bacterium]
QEISSYVWFQTAFNIQEWRPGASLWAVLERTDAPYRCWVDGEDVPVLSGANRPAPRPNRALDDPEFDWIDLSAFAVTGHHQITILADLKGIAPRPATNRHRIPLDLVAAPARLVGDFAVQDRSRGRAVTIREPAAVSLESWTLFGYPHYSGAAIYRREITAPASYRGARIFLECESCAATLAVRINGNDAGAMPWAPFRLEITELVQPGQPVTLELIAQNTGANALLGREDPSGIMGGVRLAGYRRLHLEFTLR